MVVSERGRSARRGWKSAGMPPCLYYLPSVDLFVFGTIPIEIGNSTTRVIFVQTTQ